MNRSLAKLSLLALLVLFASLLVAAGTFWHVATQTPRGPSPDREHRLTRDIAAEVGRFIAAQRVLANSLAGHSTTGGAMQPSQNPELAASVANGVRMHRLAADLSPVDGAMLSDACVAFLQRVQRGEGAFTVDYHGTDGDRHVDILHPLQSDGGAAAAFVLVHVPAQQLASALSRVVPAGASATLIQLDSVGRDVPIAQYGQAQAPVRPAVAVPIPDTPWRAELSLPGTGDLPLSALIFAVALLAPLVTLTLIFYVINRTVRKDVRALLEIFQDIRLGTVRDDYALELAEFDKLVYAATHSGRKLVQRQQRFKKLGLVDHLSQLYNRRALEERLSQLFALRETRGTSSVLIIDIDHFKSVNDGHGHAAGDVLIMVFSRALRKLVRSSDFVARLGGDEFCVIFSHTPSDQAALLVTRLREQLPATIRLTDHYEHEMRWTGGMSEMALEDENVQQVLGRADQALLKAKESGRDQTAVYHPLQGGPRATANA